MSDPNPEDPASRIKDAIFAGNKIQAMKLHREQTGLGLRESKDAMDKLEAELRISSPDRFSGPAASGCLSVVVAFAGAGIWWLLT